MEVANFGAAIDTLIDQDDVALKTLYFLTRTIDHDHLFSAKANKGVYYVYSVTITPPLLFWSFPFLFFSLLTEWASFYECRT